MLAHSPEPESKGKALEGALNGGREVKKILFIVEAGTLLLTGLNEREHSGC